jgi:hypothetical protein
MMSATVRHSGAARSAEPGIGIAAIANAKPIPDSGLRPAPE